MSESLIDKRAKQFADDLEEINPLSEAWNFEGTYKRGANDTIQTIVKSLGELYGYGELMETASKLWKEDLKKKNIPESGAFVPVLIANTEYEEEKYCFIGGNKYLMIKK